MLTKEFASEDGFIWQKYEVKKWGRRKGLPIIALKDPASGIVLSTVLSDPNQRVASEKAWMGARHSRSPLSSWEIYEEMVEKDVDADGKITETSEGKGHASVGDLARVQMGIDFAPEHLMTAIFLEGWGHGSQAKSTRFQAAFREGVLHGLENYLPKNLPQAELVGLNREYQALGALSLVLYNKNFGKIRKVYEDFYKPETKDQRAALQSRALDCVRYFLLWGVCVGGTFENAVRDNGRIISELKASPVPLYRRVARQWERLFTPLPSEEKRLKFRAEAPGLLRHTEANCTTNNNLTALGEYVTTRTDFLERNPRRVSFRGEVEQKVGFIPREYTETDRMTAQYLLTIWPGLERKKLLTWITAQTLETKEAMRKIIFAGHDRKNPMPYLARTTNLGVVIQGFLGEDRDLVRQRAWGRFLPVPAVFGQPWSEETVEQIKAMGFGLPMNLKLPEFEIIRNEFAEDLVGYYRQLDDFVRKLADKYGKTVSYEAVMNLLPMAHQLDLWMHGTPNQIPYLIDLRERPGNHCNNRVTARELAKVFDEQAIYPWPEGLTHEVNFSDRLDFFDRS